MEALGSGWKRDFSKLYRLSLRGGIYASLFAERIVGLDLDGLIWNVSATSSICVARFERRFVVSLGEC